MILKKITDDAGVTWVQSNKISSALTSLVVTQFPKYLDHKGAQELVTQFKAYVDNLVENS
jgi:hypothetical protein